MNLPEKNNQRNILRITKQHCVFSKASMHRMPETAGYLEQGKNKIAVILSIHMKKRNSLLINLQMY